MTRCIAQTKRHTQCQRKANQGDYCSIHIKDNMVDVDIFTYAYVLGYRVGINSMPINCDNRIIPSELANKIKDIFTDSKELCPMCLDEHYLCIPSCHATHGVCLSCFIQCQSICPFCKSSVNNYDKFIWIAKCPA
jgi:hypothetical protein